MLKVVKFGGTSLATAEQILKVKAIIDADPARRIIVPSAPGKAHGGDTKVTDLLYKLQELAEKKEDTSAVWQAITRRFEEIIAGLGLSLDLSGEFEKIAGVIAGGADAGASAQYAASRGEALNGRIVAALLDAEYVDAAEVILIGDNGKNDPASYENIRKRCADPAKRYVIPGFYGAGRDGRVRTFSRGGSDVTGAVAANALDAGVYENWTDVSGLLTCDPRIVENPRPVGEITYQELRDLSYMGAGVLHEDAVFPVREKGIPINIKNTNRPQDEGTFIVEKRKPSSRREAAGISGVKGHSVFTFRKAMLKEDPNLFPAVLAIFQKAGVAVEHLPAGVDTLSVVVRDKNLGEKGEELLGELEKLGPDSLSLGGNLALIAVVGPDLGSEPGFLACLFGGLARRDIPVRLADQGSSPLNLIIGVDDSRMEEALRGLYQAVLEGGF